MRQCQSLAVVVWARQNGEITNAARSTGQRLTKHHGLRVSACSVAPQRVQLGIRSSQTTDSDYSCETSAKHMQGHSRPGAYAQYGILPHGVTEFSGSQQVTKRSAVCSAAPLQRHGGLILDVNPGNQIHPRNPHIVSRFGVLSFVSRPNPNPIMSSSPFLRLCF